MDPAAIPERQHAHHDVMDHNLIADMRRGREGACAEFHARHRPLLEAYARKVRIPRWEWDTCITEVLSDEMMRFSTRDIDLPVNLSAYLVKAVYHRYLRVKRSLNCRERYHAAAATHRTGEWIVPSLCSESALRSSAGPDAATNDSSSALARFASDLDTRLTDEERSILHWIAQGVSHREIAEWIGSSYDATTKRIWRLCRRLRADAPRCAAQYEPAERSEVERFLRRAV